MKKMNDLKCFLSFSYCKVLETKVVIPPSGQDNPDSGMEVPGADASPSEIGNGIVSKK